MNNTDLPGSNQVFLHDFTKSQISVDSIKVNEFENSHVIAGKRALYKACELQNTGAMKKILNGYIQNNV